MDINKIIELKIKNRCIRSKYNVVSMVEKIIRECCGQLGIHPVEIIYCDTLKRSYSVFFLKGVKYFIYDNSLLEGLYLYNYLLINKKETDMNKFYYKLFCEELIIQEEINAALYFSRKYKKNSFSFDLIENKLDREIENKISRQNYFLILHEVGHLYLMCGNKELILSDYLKWVRSYFDTILRRPLKSGNEISKMVKMSSEYFRIPENENTDLFLTKLFQSKRFYSFVEECFCDWFAVKFLLENFDDKKESIAAASVSLNFLTTLEMIKGILKDGAVYLHSEKEALDTMYYSVMRIQMLIVMAQWNNIEEAVEGIYINQNCNLINRYAIEWLKNIPNGEAFQELKENTDVDVDERFIQELIYSIRYCSIIDE